MTENRAIPSLRSGRSATPSGPSRFASWAKLAATIASERHELIASILILIIAALGCGAIWSIPT